MKALFNRWLPGITLGAWAAAIFMMAFHRGFLDEALASGFRTYALIAAGVLAMGMLVFFCFRMDVSCCSASDCGHGLSRSALGKVVSFLILLLPASMAIWASPEALSKIQVANRLQVLPPQPPKMKEDRFALEPLARENAPAASTAESTPQATEQSVTSDYLVRSPDGVIVSEILDLLYAAQDSVLRKDFENKKISLIAQMMPDPNSDPGAKRFKAVRMFMVCCAADARPISTLVEAENLPEIPEMAWVKIVGTATFPVENGKRISLVRAESVEKTAPPKELMLN